MFFSYEFLIIKRFFFSKKTDGYISVFSWFSILGIIIGVAAIIIVMSVMNGFREELTSRIIGINGHLNIYSQEGQIHYEDVKQITNIKDIKSNIKQLFNSQEILCKRIINQLINYQDINFMQLRDNLYNIFIYQLDTTVCILFIMEYFILCNQLNKKNITYIFNRCVPFLKYFNNNYRPIYHLESFILCLCKTIHGL